jgi:hypothetical protein
MPSLVDVTTRLKEQDCSESQEEINLHRAEEPQSGNEVLNAKEWNFNFAL